MRRRALHTRAILAAAVLLGAVAPASAVVTLTPSRAEVLYSADDNPDCTALHNAADGALPFNAVRLRSRWTARTSRRAPR